jgi:nucleoside-diphosphate-sugar epimerase
MPSPDAWIPRGAVALVGASLRLRGEPVLVTGATGFVGSNLALALVAGGARVHLLARPSSSTWRLADVLGQVQVHEASLTDGNALGRAFSALRPRVVLHLATPRAGATRVHDDARARLIEETVLGASQLLRLVRQHAVERLVVTGSSLEYRPSDEPLTEESPIEPVTVHGVAKAAATLLCQQAARDSGTPVTVLRLFHVYGPRESHHRLLPSAIRAGLSNDPLPLTPGAAARDWVYVDDVIEAVVRAVDLESRGEVINVGSGAEYSNDEVVDAVARATGRPVRVVKGAFEPRSDHAPHRRADCRKAARVLGWTPRTALGDGVARTAAWFEAHPWALSHADDRPPVAT